MMHVPRVCRICLVSGVKLFEYDRYELKNYYEEIMASKINTKDHLPQHFCYECAALLHKFHKFKEKCYKGQKILEELMQKGPITLNSIKSINRRTESLQSSFNLINVNHRVKTYIIKSKQIPNVHTSPSPIEVNKITESSNDDNYIVDNNAEEKDAAFSPELVEIDSKIKDLEEISEENIHIYDEIFETVEENNVLQVENPLTDDERLSSDNEKILDDVDILENNEQSIIKVPYVVVEKKNLNHVKQNSKDSETVKKVKRFEIANRKRSRLDPNNWLKFNLSEEEAMKEFKARAQHKRFISAEYKCNDCLKGFSKEDILNRHMKLRHSESLGPIECHFCRMRFKWKCFLSKHIGQHYTKYKCLRCDLVCPLETTALSHEDYHNGVIRKCAHCDKEFKHLTTYYSHLRMHRSEHVCTLCGASFVSALGLGKHKRIKHINAESERPDDDEKENIYCKRCDIRFETRKAYQEHLYHSALHSNEEVRRNIATSGIESDGSSDGVSDKITKEPRSNKNDDVPDCPNLNLNRKYKKERTPNKPTTCYQCGKHFRSRTACYKHHLEAHPRTSFYSPNERYICEICGSSLAPASIATHQNMHAKQLGTPRYKHAKKKLHTCDTCGRQFNVSTILKRHLLTHTGEKPFACSLCDKRFTQSNSMKLHYRTFHLKQPYPKRNRQKRKS